MRSQNLCSLWSSMFIQFFHQILEMVAYVAWTLSLTSIHCLIHSVRIHSTLANHTNYYPARACATYVIRSIATYYKRHAKFTWSYEICMLSSTLMQSCVMPDSFPRASSVKFRIVHSSCNNLLLANVLDYNHACLDRVHLEQHLGSKLPYLQEVIEWYRLVSQYQASIYQYRLHT